MRLSDKVAIVTGAGGGQGRAVARRFAGEGARVALFDQDARGLEETRSLVAADGGAAIARVGDVSSAPDVAALVAATVEQFGQIDVLYNNAGVYWATATRRSTRWRTRSGTGSWRSTCAASSSAASTRSRGCCGAAPAW